MARLDYQRTVLGYHGCDRASAERVLLGRLKLTPSSNDHDWLGHGVYFWEYGPKRALQWAHQVAARWSKRIREPVVIGAVIHLGHCFDLLDVRNTDHLARLYPLFEEDLRRAGQPIPRNEHPPGGGQDFVMRRLDCAMLNWVVPVLERESGRIFQTIRGVFQEGEPAFPGSQIRRRSHIQIAVRDPECVVGYFHPQA
jgi:hypothetical protein